MSLEILISKYIDGELTRDEDNYLRNLIKDNPSAKQKFDDTVELHLEMLDDAENISVPVDLLRKTEDRIMMEIFKSAPVISVNNIKHVKRFNFNYISAAAAIIIFFFAGVLNITDSAFLNSLFVADNSLSESPKPEVIATTDSKSKINEFNANKILKGSSINSRMSFLHKQESQEQPKKEIPAFAGITILRTPLKPMNTGLVSSGGSAESKMSFLNEESVPKTAIVNDEIKEIVNADSETDNKFNSSEDFSSKRSISNPIVNYNTIDNIHLSNMDRFPMDMREIYISSFVSQDFLRSNIKTHDNTAIMNYSQSISYAVNEDSRLGIEFGLTKFFYDENKMVSISNNTQSGKSSIEVLDPNGNENTINIPVKIEQQEQFYWGSVFYEQTLFNYADFSLAGRAGFGASSDGALGYSLIMVNYSVYQGIFLSAGAEGRIFRTQIPILGYNSLTSSLSVIYGIKFQF